MEAVKTTPQLQKYPAYKDSNVKWLGKIPQHWKVTPGLSFLYEAKEKNTGFKRKQVLSLSYGKIREKGEDELTGLVPESFESYQLVDAGDIIFRPTDLQNDKISLRSAMSDFDGIITSAYLNLRLKKIADARFYHYFFRSIDNNKIIYGLGSGLRQNIDYRDFRRFRFPFPPKQEQTAIASFLDRKCGKIDTAIAQKQQLIELLKERKQIIIQELVTGKKVWNKEKNAWTEPVEVKDSGVEWIGEIPEHWEVKELRYISNSYPSNVDKHSKKNELPVLLCNYTDVYKNEFITKELDFMEATATDEQIKRFKLLKGDIIITKDSETAEDIAAPALVKENLQNVICGYHLAMIRPNKGILSEFLFRQLQTKIFNIQFEICANGITRVGLGTTDMKSAKFLVPPLSEQSEIAALIEKQSEKLDLASSYQTQQIEKLKEYKRSLIDAAVTGKIKVN